MQNVISINNKPYKGASGRMSLYDLHVPSNWNGKLIIFIHGYMGYKDWGCWNLVQDYFVNHNFGFLKYNVSHNGGTTENPIDFSDLEAFAKNTYSKEIEDFEAILEVVSTSIDNEPEIYLIGHSRGGGIALLQSENERVSKICSWAGIASIGSRFPSGEVLEEWKSIGVRYGKNGRTKQDMPHDYEQYEDYVANSDRLDIEAYCNRSSKPTLVVHGANDTSVKPEEGELISHWLDVPLLLIEETQHTFDSAQPWTQNEMPSALLKACELTLNFLNTK